jgi:uncharacterized repeat protein (TIGR01451 family)
MGPAAVWSGEAGNNHRMAWGDWNGDGWLDLAVAIIGYPILVYQNSGGTLTPVWASPESDYTMDVAWGDWDGDGDLDLAAANSAQDPNRVYENTGITLTLTWSSPEMDDTTSLAWGDWDGDGDLDLGVGNVNGVNRVYANTGTTLTLAWSSDEMSETMDVAWGDWDNDGDLDLAVANDLQPTQVYENAGGGLTLAWSSAETNRSQGLAWGDWNADGFLDLAVANRGQPDRIFNNTGGSLTPAWTSADSYDTNTVAWVDWDGDGDLDLATGNGPNARGTRVYDNWGPAIEPVAVWSSEEDDAVYGLAWGDWDNDGDLDLAAGNYGGVPRIYENNRVSPGTLPNTAPHPFVYRPGSSDDAFFFGSAEILTDPQIPIWFRLYDPEGDTVPRIAARYSTNGGGQWHAATIQGNTTDLAAGPGGVPHQIQWDAAADGARGDNVLFRVISVLDDPTQVATPIQRPYVATETPPFRLRPLAVTLFPPRKVGIGPGGAVITHTFALFNRTGRTGVFTLTYDSFRGWPVDGPVAVGPIPDLGFRSFTVSTTVAAGPPQIIDVVTVTAGASFNPTTFNGNAHIFTYRGDPDVDLSIEKNVPATTPAGIPMTYTLTVGNGGPSPAGGVVVTDTLPAEVSFSWASGDGIYSPTLGAVLWTDKVLLANRPLTFTVGVTVHCVPSGTIIAADDYSVSCDQETTPVTGPAAATTVLYNGPVAGFAASASELDAGTTLALTNTSQFATAYLWSFGDSGSSTVFEPMHTYLTAGSYTITLAATNACGADEATSRVTVFTQIYLPLVLKGP